MIYETKNQINEWISRIEKYKRRFSPFSYADKDTIVPEGYTFYQDEYDNQGIKVKDDFKLPDFMIIALAKFINMVFHKQYKDLITGKAFEQASQNRVYIKSKDYDDELRKEIIKENDTSPSGENSLDLYTWIMNHDRMYDLPSDDNGYYKVAERETDYAIISQERHWNFKILNPTKKEIKEAKEDKYNKDNIPWESGRIIFVPKYFKNGNPVGYNKKVGNHEAQINETRFEQTGKWIRVPEHIPSGFNAWRLSTLVAVNFHFDVQEYAETGMARQLSCGSGGIFNCDQCFNENFILPLTCILNMDSNQERLFRKHVYKNIDHCVHSSGIDNSTYEHTPESYEPPEIQEDRKGDE